MDSTNMTALSASSDYSQIVAENIDTLLEINRNSDKYVACFNELYWIIICAKGIQQYTDLQTEQGFTDIEFWERLNTIFNNISELGLIASNITSINDLVTKLNENPSLLEETINSLDLAYANFYTHISEAKDEMLNIIQTATNTAKTEILSLINLVSSSIETSTSTLFTTSLAELENKLISQLNEFQTQYNQDISNINQQIADQYTKLNDLIANPPFPPPFVPGDNITITPQTDEFGVIKSFKISSTTSVAITGDTGALNIEGGNNITIEDRIETTEEEAEDGTITTTTTVVKVISAIKDSIIAGNNITLDSVTNTDGSITYTINADVSNVDLTNYLTNEEINTLLTNYVTQTQLTEIINSLSNVSTTEYVAGSNITITEEVPVLETVASTGYLVTGTNFNNNEKTIASSFVSKTITYNGVEYLYSKVFTNKTSNLSVTTSGTSYNLIAMAINYSTDKAYAVRLNEASGTWTPEINTWTPLTTIDITTPITSSGTEVVWNKSVTIDIKVWNPSDELVATLGADVIPLIDNSTDAVLGWYPVSDKAKAELEALESTPQKIISATVPTSSGGAIIEAGTNVTIEESVNDAGETVKTISATDTTYTAGSNVTISNTNEISVDLSNIEIPNVVEYEAGDNITFTENATTSKTTISAELSYKYQGTFTLQSVLWDSSSKECLASLTIPSSSGVTTDSYISLSGNISAYSTIASNNVTLSSVGLTNNVLILTFTCTSIPQSDILFMVTIK